MKGIIFTEFLELVEEKFGLEMVDTIIKSSELKSNGVYTGVGTYSFGEMVQLLGNLSKETAIAPDDLLYVFAEHLFATLATNYPGLMNTYSDPMDLLSSIESHIHVEVRKIYSDAELPTFTVISRSDSELVMDYQSSRALYSLGHGLMQQTFNHFDQSADISYQKLKDDGTKVRFTIRKK
ncbi:heme NO-binding domain-containing protein [Aureitalea marina]|uniref:Heme NO-binding domain-containing protein n=1 Tax=Aureitalea marina TaxID=930804 RepID=A0A2S7KLH6_9FLAO|nr:heme NO-binding domain-containing protein [Aureitalea marina]PQB03485.1 hypothetical protein BST85_00185 [Aureitalea marina]